MFWSKALRHGEKNSEIGFVIEKWLTPGLIPKLAMRRCVLGKDTFVAVPASASDVVEADSETPTKRKIIGTDSFLSPQILHLRGCAVELVNCNRNAPFWITTLCSNFLSGPTSLPAVVAQNDLQTEPKRCSALMRLDRSRLLGWWARMDEQKNK